MDLLKKNPAVLLAVIGGLATAALTAWQTATATGNTGLALALGFAGLFIPSATGVLARAKVVPVERVEQALRRLHEASQAGHGSLTALEELEALTRAEINRDTFTR